MFCRIPRRLLCISLVLNSVFTSFPDRVFVLQKPYRTFFLLTLGFFLCDAYLISFLLKYITLSILTHPYWLPQYSWLTVAQLITCNFKHLSDFECVWQFGMDLAYSHLFSCWLLISYLPTSCRRRWVFRNVSV